MKYSDTKTARDRNYWKLSDGGLTMVAGQQGFSPEERLAFRILGQREYAKLSQEAQAAVISEAMQMMLERARKRARVSKSKVPERKRKMGHFYNNAVVDPWLNL